MYRPARPSGSLLVMTSPADTGAPPWFSAALAAAARERRATFDGTSIAYRVWGDPADRNIVLVHGGAAHSHWWDHIAPLHRGGASPAPAGPRRQRGARRSRAPGPGQPLVVTASLPRAQRSRRQ